MSEEVNWSEFIGKFKPVQCRVVDGKLVCEGMLDDKKAVCEITEDKHQVKCIKEPTTAV